MNCADDFLKFVSKWVLENCLEDLKFLSKRVDPTIVDRLQLLTSSSFQRISYAEAVEVLKQVILCCPWLQQSVHGFDFPYLTHMLCRCFLGRSKIKNLKQNSSWVCL